MTSFECELVDCMLAVALFQNWCQQLCRNVQDTAMLEAGVYTQGSCIAPSQASQPAILDDEAVSPAVAALPISRPSCALHNVNDFRIHADPIGASPKENKAEDAEMADSPLSTATVGYGMDPSGAIAELNNSVPAHMTQPGVVPTQLPVCDPPAELDKNLLARSGDSMPAVPMPAARKLFYATPEKRQVRSHAFHELLCHSDAQCIRCEHDGNAIIVIDVQKSHDKKPNDNSLFLATDKGHWR